MGTDYARGTAGLSLVCDGSGNLLTASVSIYEGSFVTGLRKCTKNGTSFSFRPHDDFYSATLLPALSSSEAQAIYVKEHGGSTYFTGVTVNGPDIISEIDLEGTGYNAPEEDAYPHFGGINGSKWKVETGDISWIEYSTPNGDPTATITDGSGNKSVNVTIKSKFKKKHVQKNEDNSIKGLKSVTIKVKVPAGKNGKTKTPSLMTRKRTKPRRR